MDAGSPVSGSGDRGEKEKAKRGYRACLHCRSRKAKCDLGDIDAPSEPPCSRCKRESRECVFAPSRRGGNNMRRKAESLGLDLGLRDEKDFMDGLHTAEGEGSSTVSGGIAGHGGRRSAISIEAYNGLEAEYHPTQRHSFSATPDRPGPHAVQDPSPFTGNIEGAAQAGNNNKGARGAHAQGGPSGLYTAQGVRISPNASAPSVLHVASARTTSANDHPSTSQGSQSQSSRSQQKSQYQPALGPIPLSDVEADNFTSASHARPRPYGSSLKDLLHSSSPQHNPYSGAGSNGAMSSLDPSPAAATGSPTTSTNHPTPHWGISTGTGTLAETGHASLVGRKGLDGRDGRESSTSPKRRRLHLNPPLHADDPSSLVVADVQNESDALHILALASGSGRGGRDGDRRGQGRHADEDLDNLTEGAALARRPGEGVGGSRGIYNQTLQTEQGGLTDDGRDEHGQASSTAYQRKGPISALLARQGADGDPLSRSRSQSKALISTRGRKSSVSRELKDYELVRKGIVPEDVACRLVDVFFRCHHHLFPMVPASLIPRTKDEIGVFANNERYLMTAIIIIASRNDMSIARVHDEAWALFRVWLSDITCLGEQPTVGLVEALLLLAENLPRDPSKDSESSHVHGAENRQSWMLIGCAIRNAYGLGIDKIASRFVPPQERTFELERARLAWTYCYLFDRHVSLRLGLAFWSRGPSTCFQGFSDSAQTGPAAAAANFPYLVENTQGPERDRQEDMAGLVQAYLELTQIMTNAHDVLYPNTARTRSLVMYGEYFKYIDELMRSLEGFKILWQHKKWNIFPLNDVLWAMYFYTQLYLCAFSFQAHVERAAMRAEEEYSAMNEQHKAAGGTGDLPRPPLSLFPRGAAASPDCRYIFQSCDAARTLLHICTDSLGPGGALPFLPSRYLLWFTYAAIVLLKALYSGAMLRADHAETLSLIDQLCVCLAGASTDDEHPAVRYGRQLEALRKKLASSTSADSQGPGSPLGIGGVTTVAPDVPASMAKAPAVSVSKKGKVLAKSRTSTKSGSSGRDNASTTAAGASRQAGKGILDSPVWTMPAAPDHSDGVSFAYPATPIDHASTSVKTEQANMTHDRDVRHADPPILSNFMMSQNAPYTAPHGQYPQFAHSQQAGSGHAIAQQQQPPGLPFIPPNTVGEGYNPFASQNAANNGLSMMPLGNMSYHAVNDHLGDNASSNFPMAFGPTQHANQQLPVQQSGQPTQHLQQPTGTMGADFEVNNLGFPQLLDDWFGPVQEEDETLGALDLQDFWMKVGPGEAQGGFPFR